MPADSIKNDLRDFVQFATRRIELGETSKSVEDLVQQWRCNSEYSETVLDIRQGIQDDAGGKAESVEDVFVNVRRMIGIIE